MTNGSKLLPLSDGRSVTARRFKDLVEFICVDLGGADRLSEGEKQLVRRAAALSAELERQEALWARGEAEFDISAYSVLTNALRRVLETIGLRRRPRDVTTLGDILAGRDTEPAEAVRRPSAKIETAASEAPRPADEGAGLP